MKPKGTGLLLSVRTWSGFDFFNCFLVIAGGYHRRSVFKIERWAFQKSYFSFLIHLPLIGAKTALCNANSQYTKKNQTSLLCFPGKTCWLGQDYSMAHTKDNMSCNVKMKKDHILSEHVHWQQQIGLCTLLWMKSNLWIVWKGLEFGPVTMHTIDRMLPKMPSKRKWLWLLCTSST